MFILLEITGGSTNIENLIKYGAKYNPAIMEGEWWRFVTPIFLHIGLSHVIMNSIAIYFLGTIVERVYGRIRFILIYLFQDLLVYLLVLFLVIKYRQERVVQFMDVLVHYYL